MGSSVPGFVAYTSIRCVEYVIWCAFTSSVARRFDFTLGMVFQRERLLGSTPFTQNNFSNHMVDRFLSFQRIAAANQAIRKKHKIKEAMEKMRATNNFHSIDALL